MESYTYQRLDATRKEFRLLVPDPLPADATEAHILTCHLQHACFGDSEPPVYETISYVWGDPTPCKSLLVDGRLLKVPKNTEQTLRQFAFQRRGHRVLWIDAVCVNQEDVSERSQQALLMGQIYKNSTCNLINLGDDDELVGRAISNINDIIEEIRDETDDFTCLKDVLLPNGGWGKATSSPKTAIDIDAVIHFYSRPWFRRVWVVQEAMLAVRNHCRCGAHETSFDAVILTAAWLYRYHSLHIPRSLYEIPGLKNAASMLGHRLLRGNRSMSVGYALSLASKLEASDARDKVFGMFGLLNVDQTLPVSRLIMPDYTKPSFEVFRDAVRYTIERGHTLYILTSISHHGDEDIVADGFPSWVPRLDRGSHHDLDPNNLVVAYSQPFGVRMGGHEAQGIGQKEPDVLYLRGTTIGRISSRSPAFQEQDMTALNTCVYKMVDQDPPNKSRLAQTLCAGTTHTGQRQPHILEAQFESWLENYLSAGQQLRTPQQLPSDASDLLRKATYFQKAMLNAMHLRSFATTDSGRMALVPKVAKEGDIIASFRGGLTPFALRKLETGGFHLLGECYLEGYMGGEAFVEQAENGIPETIYRII